MGHLIHREHLFVVPLTPTSKESLFQQRVGNRTEREDIQYPKRVTKAPEIITITTMPTIIGSNRIPDSTALACRMT